VEFRPKATGKKIFFYLNFGRHFHLCILDKRVYLCVYIMCLQVRKEADVADPH